MPHETAPLIFGICFFTLVLLLWGSILFFNYLQKRKISRQIERGKKDYYAGTDIAGLYKDSRVKQQ